MGFPFLGLLSMLAAFGPPGSDPLGGPGSGLIQSVTLRPYLATDQDEVAVRVCGSAFGLVYGTQATSSVSGSTIEVDVFVANDSQQFPYFMGWCADAAVGLLAAGEYTVIVHVTASDGSAASLQTPVTVSPALFCWDHPTVITSNDVSDSFPAPVAFNDRLHLFWNKTYDGSVVSASFDGISWTDDATIADCGTRSAVGAAVLGDRIHVFYSRSIGYPTSHLFYKSSADGVTWTPEQEITTGGVYDDYGAMATVHDGRVHVLWKRWQDDGYRYVYSMTYDGASFGPPTQLWRDGYIDSPVSAASFQGKLYVFYGGGVLYRVLEGASWSDEQRASNAPPFMGSEGASPASVVLDGRLILLLLSDMKMLCAAVHDGTAWTESRVSAQPEAEDLLYLGAAVYHGDVHLISGGGYWNSTGKLSSRVLADVDGDSVPNGCDTCPTIADPDQLDQDGDAYGAACDCDDADDTIHPGAPETNDGRDNQCPGDTGSGSVNEISGVTGFSDPGDASAYCWAAQAGASEYEAKRADCATMCSPCESFVTTGPCWHDPARPLAGSAFFYLVRAMAPHVGDWGLTSQGSERTVCP